MKKSAYSSNKKVQSLFSGQQDGSKFVGTAALKESDRTGLDLVRPSIPESWKRKTERAGSLLESFYHAFHGLSVALAEQRNLKIHVCLAAVVVAAGLALQIDLVSWMGLTIVMAVVIAAELFNTSLEHLVDVYSNGQYSYAARLAKDTAAAAVLVVSIGAVIVGGLIFLPRLFPSGV